MELVSIGDPLAQTIKQFYAAIGSECAVSFETSPEAELLLADDSQRRGSAVISTFKTSLKCSRFNKNIKENTHRL